MGKGWIYKMAKIYKVLHSLQTLGADEIHRRAVIEEAEINAKCRVLDLGTGTALTAIKASSTGACVVGVDNSSEMVEQARKNVRKDGLEKVEIVKGKVEKLPFPDDSFSRIISCYGLGGVEEIKKAFQEIVRVSEPGAIITIAEMVKPPKREKTKKFIHDHLVEPWIKFFWGFRSLELVSLFEEVNIKVLKTMYFSDRVIGSTLLVKGIVIK